MKLSKEKLAEKIILWSLVIFSIVMTVNYFKLNFAFNELGANYLAISEVQSIGDYCKENSVRTDGNYEISLENNGEIRTVTIKWSGLFSEKETSLSFSNPPECQN